jgi:hypothetical protein
MDPILLALLLTVGGGVAGGLAGAASGASATGSNENINTAYKDNPIYKMLFGEGGKYAQWEGQFSDMLSGALKQGNAAAAAYDPTAAWKDFLSASPELMNLISGSTGSVKSALESNLADFTKTAVSEAGSNMSGMGSLYSGALGDIIGKNVGAEAAKSNVELSTLLTNLYGSMGNNLLSLFSSNESNKASLGMQAASLGVQGAGLYSGLMGQSLGIGADLSSPVYEYKPGILDYILQGLGVGGNLGGALGQLVGTKAKSTTTDSTQGGLYQDPTLNNPNYGGSSSVGPNFKLYPKTGYWPN